MASPLRFDIVRLCGGPADGEEWLMAWDDRVLLIDRRYGDDPTTWQCSRYERRRTPRGRRRPPYYDFRGAQPSNPVPLAGADGQAVGVGRAIR